MGTHVAQVPASLAPPVSHSGWTSYTNANYVRDLTFDANGALWAVGSGGAVRWDIRRGTYTKYIVNDGLASTDVSAVAALPGGEIWFGTDRGVSRFDGRTWTTYTKADGVGER
jgi:ligand-binding sensor domain-containing protein